MNFSWIWLINHKYCFFLLFLYSLEKNILPFDKKNKFFLFSLNQNFRNFGSAEVTLAQQNQNLKKNLFLFAFVLAYL